MKKETKRRLSLHRETLAQLEGQDGAKIAGAFPISFTCSGNQPCQSISYCYVCRTRDVSCDVC